MRIELTNTSVERVVNIWRDSNPLRGEKSPDRVAVEEYGAGRMWSKTVATTAIFDTPRWQQFLIEETPEGNRLLAALKGGPIKPTWRGDSWLIDLDRVQRAR